MSDLWNNLLSCLDLSPVSERLSEEPAGERLFRGANQKLEYHRVFGGQILGQFIESARATCPGKSVKSLHTLFPREGRAEEPITYEVRRQHEGRTFATLSITASQSSGIVATAAVSMHASEDGRERQEVEPVPAPLGPEHTLAIDMIPWEIRTTDDLNDDAAAPPEFELWMQTPEVDPALAPALTAYATDLTLIGTALRPIDGVNQRGNGTAFTSAVTSHTLWFHRPFRTDQWLLLRQHSPMLAHGRTFGRGDVLTEDGALVVSYAQEALVRFRD
ncbi:acyl-CoA thioesterase II [soil metagenome]